MSVIRTMLVAVAAAVALTAGTRAADAQQMEGAYGMSTFVQRVAASCPGAAALSYRGGGSDCGEQALLDGRQKVAPMRGASSGWSGPARLQTLVRRRGFLVALDALAVVADIGRRCVLRRRAGACGNHDCPYERRARGAVSGMWATSTCSTIGATRCGCSTPAFTTTPPPRRIATATCATPWRRGSHAVRGRVRRRRRSVLGAAARLPTGRSPNGSETFRALLGLPAIPAPALATPVWRPGPIPLPRSRTSATSRIAILCAAPAPPGSRFAARTALWGSCFPSSFPRGSQPAVAHPGPCQQGKMGFFLGPQFPGRCPNGKPTLFGKCFVPIMFPNSPACVNLWPNNCPFFTPGGTDCRAYNLFTWGPDQRLALVSVWPHVARIVASVSTPRPRWADSPGWPATPTRRSAA